MRDTNRLDTDLAWLWPMWGDAATEDTHYCQHVAESIRRYATRPVSTLLDIGCGGGKNVLNLKQAFEVTGVDLSPDMLAQAKDLNPGCMFVQGDMRSFRLGRIERPPRDPAATAWTSSSSRTCTTPIPPMIGTKPPSST